MPHVHTLVWVPELKHKVKMRNYHKINEFIKLADSLKKMCKHVKGVINDCIPVSSVVYMCNRAVWIRVWGYNMLTNGVGRYQTCRPTTASLFIYVSPQVLLHFLSTATLKGHIISKTVCYTCICVLQSSQFKVTVELNSTTFKKCHSMLSVEYCFAEVRDYISVH